MIERIEIVTWYKCNASCTFCASGNGGGGFSTKDIIGLLESKYAEGIRAVDFGGGEPTAREDLVVIVQLAKEIGYEKIGIKTNGLRLCYPEYVTELIYAGADAFSVSIWGHDRRTHDALAGRNRAFDMTVMGIKHLVDFGAEVCIDIMLSSGTSGHLNEFMEKFIRLEIKQYRLWLFSIFGSGGLRSELMPKLAQAGFEAQNSAKKFKNKVDFIRTSHIMPCLLGAQRKMYFNASSLRLLVITPGGEFMAEESPFEAGVKIDACRNCRMSKSCAGPRSEYLERFGGGEFKSIK